MMPAACSLDAGGLLAPGDEPADAASPVPPPRDATVIDDRAMVDTGPSPPADVTSPVDAITADDSPGDGTIPVDTGAPDAVDEPPVTNCDQDGDGYTAVACGGNECCDMDANANPGQTSYFTFATNCGTWDYNCDGVVELLYSVVACSGHGGACGGSGIAAPGTCGTNLAAQSCVWSPPACVPQDTGTTEQQACQ